MTIRSATILLALALGAGLATVAVADDANLELRFHDHHFEPQSLSVPSGKALLIKVVNDSQETIEFESFKLNREKALSPGETITVWLPALSAGTFDFYDDFHQDVPEGTIVAK